MKLLVFEYITGGGCCSEPVSEHLVHEGLLMLTALLNDLGKVSAVRVTVMLDARLLTRVTCDLTRVTVVPVYAEPDWLAVMDSQLPYSDAVWPIAPEINDTLLNLTRRIESHNKTILSSSVHAVALTGNKLHAWEVLAAHGIPSVPTDVFTPSHLTKPGRYVIKPIDGMGCEQTYFVENGVLSMALDCTSQHIIQPYIGGRSMSFSCLFAQGNAWVICVNTQKVQIKDGQFKLVQCIVNSDARTIEHQALVERIALAFPGLWGYVGIDLIEYNSQLYVLEINPRLTTSYAGIYDALGLNIAELVINMNEKKPDFVPPNNKSIIVSVSRDSDAS